MTYLFCVRSEHFSFAAASDLANQDVEHLLAEYALALTLQDVTGVFLDCWLAHHSHRSVAGATWREGGQAASETGSGVEVEVLGNGHVDVAGGFRAAVLHVALGMGVGVGCRLGMLPGSCCFAAAEALLLLV